MPNTGEESECNLFEVILYFENNAWLFSTCAYSSHWKAALEVAEREFSIHALHHKLGNLRANSACVIDRLDDHYFAKRDGKWQIEMRPPRAMPAADHGVALHF